MNPLGKQFLRNGALVTAIALAAAAAFTVQPAQGAKPASQGKCDNPPLTFTIQPAYTDPDTKGVYTSAMQGNASEYVGAITTCNGSNTATMSPNAVVNSGGWVKLNLGSAVSGNNSTAGTYVHFMSFSNILYVPDGVDPLAVATTDFSFTTYLKITLKETATATSINNYYFNLENPDANAPFNAPTTPDTNTPCTTALVHVHHPAATAETETWEAWPDTTTASSCTGSPTQVGTLLGPNPKKGKYVSANVGQFKFPFFITIRRR